MVSYAHDSDSFIYFILHLKLKKQLLYAVLLIINHLYTRRFNFIYTKQTYCYGKYLTPDGQVY